MAASVSIWDSRVVIIAVAVIRAFSLLIWFGCGAYGSYQVYLASLCLYFPAYLSLPHSGTRSVLDINIGLNRERDSIEDEWDLFLSSLITKTGYWLCVYTLVSYFISELSINIRMLTSILMTSGLCIHLMGWRSVIFIYQQPIIYCILMAKCRRRWWIWTVAISFLWFNSSQWLVSSYVIVRVEDWESAEYWFLIISAWNCMRCLSFCFDNWTNPDPSLWNLLAYCFYFPTALTGPIVLYETFERDILQRQGKRRSLKFLLSKFCYLGIIICTCELILRVLHFRKLTLYSHLLWKLNLWAVGGLMFCLGQFFQLKYLVLYGIGTRLAEYEGLTMPPLPKCPARMHRYSVLWKDFDRGLFHFLVRYNYVPMIEALEKWGPVTKKWHPELKKLVASSVTFCYIYIWHGLYYNVMVWTAWNFLGITIERAGSFVKRKIDTVVEMHELFWDFVVEPVFTTPLAAMSILNSVVFLSNLTAAKIFTERILSSWNTSLVLPVVYCLTHAAIGVRTWPQFWPKLKAALAPPRFEKGKEAT